MQLSPRTSLPTLVLLSALSASAAAQVGGVCARPGMDIAQGVHPYGPIDPGDGAVDIIDAPTNTKLELLFSVDGLDHEKSLAVSGDFLTVGVLSATPAAAPLPIAPCATLQLPFDAYVLPVPASTLEVQAKVEKPGPVGLTEDVWFQTATVDLATPGTPLAMSDLARIRLRQGPFQGDPATLEDFGCSYWGSYVWDAGVGPVAGRIHWPSPCDGDPDPDGVYPLVVICHGEGQSHTDYEYLAQHLARNGFVVASVDGGQGLSNEDRAQRVHTFLRFVRDHWEYQANVENTIGLLGHGRGAEAMTRVAELNLELGKIDGIRTVVQLAPTDEGDDGVKVDLTLEEIRSLLVIAGSMDEVVTGYCVDGTAPDCGAAPTGPQRTGFAVYDRAAHESSTEELVSVASIEKAMLFVEGADHGRWGEPCSDPTGSPPVAPIDCEAHHDTLKSYLNAWLRYQLRDQADFRPYFTGEWTPAAVLDAGVRVQNQYADSLGRRVIDNFGNGKALEGNLASLSYAGLVIEEHADAHLIGNGTVPHRTGAMTVRWSGQGAPGTLEPFLRWSLDPGQDGLGNVYRDFSGHAWLSVRIGQLDDEPLNSPGAPSNVRVTLRDGSGAYSATVWGDAIGELPYPHESVVTTPDLQVMETTKSCMRTLRIPLSHFTGVDLSDVREIVFSMGDPILATSGAVLIDSLELAK